MLGELIYEARGKITYTKLIELDPIIFEGSYIAHGRLRNDTGIKEHCTFTSIQKSNDIVYGEGKHLLIVNNDTIRWIGRGFGKRVDNKQVWRGAGIFESTIESFNDIVGVVEAEIVDEQLQIKVWEWR